ncbi:TrbC/VirB2 family protein [Candidatus Pacearchaeota archaeon]|nr:TrbC/VirB2 family protein [Candidatus Pacearchaeota archaeon]
MKKWNLLLLLSLALVLTIATPVLASIDLSEEISAEDEASFDEILEPVMDVYSFIKYVATAIAALVLVGAGIVFMLSGSDPAKRDQAKNMIMYVIFGLIIIWIAPLIVEYLVQ